MGVFSGAQMFSSMCKMVANRIPGVHPLHPLLPYMDSLLSKEGQRWRNKMALYGLLFILSWIGSVWCLLVIPHLWKTQ